MFMNKISIILLVLLTQGCTTYSMSRVPDEVAVLPTDCANKTAIERFLIERSESPKATLQTNEEYNRGKSYYKTALWQLRYNCYPASGTTVSKR